MLVLVDERPRTIPALWPRTHHEQKKEQVKKEKREKFTKRHNKQKKI